MRQILALFDRAMKMFSPFAFRPDETTPPPPPTKNAEPAKDDDAIAELRRQMDAMQQQLAALAKK